MLLIEKKKNFQVKNKDKCLKWHDLVKKGFLIHDFLNFRRCNIRYKKMLTKIKIKSKMIFEKLFMSATRKVISIFLEFKTAFKHFLAFL